MTRVYWVQAIKLREGGGGWDIFSFVYKNGEPSSYFNVRVPLYVRIWRPQMADSDV